MKYSIAMMLLIFFALSQAAEESADKIARRVISEVISKNKLSNEKQVPQGIGSREEDFQLADTSKQCQDLVRNYMLSDAVSEKIRIAYAITLLAKRRQPQPSIGEGVVFDKEKNEKYLKDGLVLIARIKEIEKAEQSGAVQPRSSP